MAHKYTITRRIGHIRGALLFQAIDRKSGSHVVVKEASDVFSNPTDAQRAYREIMYLHVRLPLATPQQQSQTTLD